MLTTYAIKGSKRLHSADSTQSAALPINTRIDLIQFFNFEKSLAPVLKHMRKESDDQRRKKEQLENYDDEMSKLRRELERREKEQREREQRGVDPL